MRLIAAMLIALVSSAQAQDITGTWQADGKPQRVLKITRTAQGYRGDFYNLGDEAPGAPRNNSVSTIVLTGTAMSFSLDKAQGDFLGQLSNDAQTLTGSWKTLYGGAQPLTFARTAKKGEWVIDP